MGQVGETVGDRGRQGHRWGDRWVRQWGWVGNRWVDSSVAQGAVGRMGGGTSGRTGGTGG